MAIGNLELKQDAKNPDRRWLYGTDALSGNPFQYTLDQNQFAQFQNAGLKPTQTFNDPLYYNRGAFNADDLINNFGGVAAGNYGGLEQMNTKNQGYLTTLRGLSNLATTGGYDLANDAAALQHNIDYSMGGSKNFLTPGSDDFKRIEAFKADPANQASSGPTYTPGTSAPQPGQVTGTLPNGQSATFTSAEVAKQYGATLTPPPGAGQQPLPTQPSGTPVLQNPLPSNPGQPAPAPSGAASQVLNNSGQSALEISLQQQLDQLNTNSELGKAAIAEQPIATGFISGQQFGVERRTALAALPLKARLAAEQARRQASIDVAKTQYQIEQDTLARNDRQETQNYNRQQDTQQFNTQQAENMTFTDPSKPFYFVGQEVRSKATNRGFATPEEAFAAGVARDFSNVEQPAGKQYELSEGQSLVDANGNLIYKNPKTYKQGTPNEPDAPDTFTQTQINKGAANSGLTIAEFRQLPTDTQNRYINGDLSQRLTTGEKNERKAFIDTEVKNVGLGELRRMIDDSNIPQLDKEELKKYAEEAWRR